MKAEKQVLTLLQEIATITRTYGDVKPFCGVCGKHAESGHTKYCKLAEAIKLLEENTGFHRGYDAAIADMKVKP